jgi:hypothetical protein
VNWNLTIPIPDSKTQLKHWWNWIQKPLLSTIINKNIKTDQEPIKSARNSEKMKP